MAFVVYNPESLVFLSLFLPLSLSLYTKDPYCRSQVTEEGVADWDMMPCSMVDAETAQSVLCLVYRMDNRRTAFDSL